jgi:hypothetical protein
MTYFFSSGGLKSRVCLKDPPPKPKASCGCFSSDTITHLSGFHSAYFYNHTRRLRLEKLLYIVELSRSPNGYFKPLMDPGGGFRSETAVTEVKRLQIYNGYMQRPFLNGRKCPFGCNGYVTAMAVGQRQRLYSGVRMFTGNYLNSTPRALRCLRGWTWMKFTGF